MRLERSPEDVQAVSALSCHGCEDGDSEISNDLLSKLVSGPEVDARLLANLLLHFVAKVLQTLLFLKFV